MSVAEGDLLWEPSEEIRRNARVARFMAERGFGSYDELWQWSVTDIDAFWDAVWSHFDVLGERGDGPVREGDPGDWGAPAGSTGGMPGVHWFPGATINYARNALRTGRDPDATAIVFRNEARAARALTYGELAAQVAEVRAGLRELGVDEGRPGRGVRPEHPRGARRVPGDGLARGRSGPRARPTSGRPA